MPTHSRSVKCTLIILSLFTLPAFAGSTVPGIHNFYQVDSRVYRGAQPTSEGLSYLAKIGVKTVLDLREPGVRSRHEEHVVTSLGMHYVNVPMGALAPPTEDQISKILALLEDSKSGAVFVHCRRGADRTGAVIGAYRIDFDHWDNATALQEAIADGMSFFQLPRQTYIRSFRPRALQARANAEAPKIESAGTPAAAAPAPAGTQ